MAESGFGARQSGSWAQLRVLRARPTCPALTHVPGAALDPALGGPQVR